MRVDVREIGDLRQELSVEIPADVVNDQLEQAFTEARREATIKGFRQGKAPMSIIKSRFGDAVRADVADQLIRDSYPRAVDERQLKVATRPTITSVDYGDDGSFRYTATVEVFPGLERVSFDNLRVTSVDTQVADEDVEALAESLRMMYADLRPVDREVRDTDLVVADLKKLYDPNLALKKEHLQGVEIDLARAFTVREFREQLPGMKVGQQKEIEVTYDPDYPDEVFAGAQITYLVTVKGVQERILPEFNDAFAKRTGKAVTALELRLKLREDLRRQQTDQNRKLQKSQVIRQICESNLVPVPEGMIEDYVGAILEDGRSNNPNMDEEELRTYARPVAENTLRWNMLYHHIAEQEGIEVSQIDTDQFIKSVAAEHKITEAQARRALTQTGKLSSLRDTLLEEKVIDFLIARAEVVSTEHDLTSDRFVEDKEQAK